VLVADFAVVVAIVEAGLAHGALHLSQVGRHHKLGIAWLDRTVTVEHLNRSASTRHIFNQRSVVRAIPGIAFGLRGSAYSVAILKYGLAHDALPSGSNALHEGRFRSRCIGPTPMRDREEVEVGAETSRRLGSRDRQHQANAKRRRPANSSRMPSIALLGARSVIARRMF
jgi:hypothetical protein